MNRVAFTIFGIDVMWYGILIGIGMLLGVLLAMREARRKHIEEDHIFNIALFAFPIAIICARLYYVIFSWDYYSFHPSEIIDIRGGGLAIHGALIGGLLTGYVYCRVKKLSFFDMADTVMIGMPLAQAIGRWGNFINVEAHGGPTNLPWGIMVNGQKVHPTFLYESIWDFMVFIVLMRLTKKRKFDGQLVCIYLILYSIGRFMIEGLRTDSLMLGPIRMAQLISLVLIVVGAIGYHLLKKRGSE